MITRVQKDFPGLEPISMQICIRLLALGSELLVLLDKLLEPYDLGHGRWVTMLLLRRRKVWQALPSELAQEQGVTRATMSGLLNRLEKKGLVSRETDPDDGRRSVIVLTDEGARIVDEVFPLCHEMVKEVLSGLDPEEKERLLPMLDSVLSGIR